MVVEELLASVIERLGVLAGAHGLEAGLVATALIILWHGHSALAFAQSALRTARIGFVGAGLVGLLIVVGISMGWLDVGVFPNIGDLLNSIPIPGL